MEEREVREDELDVVLDKRELCVDKSMEGPETKTTKKDCLCPFSSVSKLFDSFVTPLRDRNVYKEVE